VLLATVFGLFPFLRKRFADSAYQGPIFHGALAGILPRIETEIVKRSDQAKGFVVLPKRWIVERTIAWLGRCRRLACLKGMRSIKDWENLTHNALAFLKLASIRLMLRKLCNPC
jgi:transposase